MGIRLVGAFILVGIFAVDAWSQETPYRVSIQAGLSSRMTPQQVAQKVLEDLARARFEDARVVDEKGAIGLVPPKPEVLSMDLVDGMNLGSVLGADSGYPEFPGKKVWVVRARGRFAWKQFEQGSGQYYLDDTSGEILGFGARGALPAGK